MTNVAPETQTPITQYGPPQVMPKGLALTALIVGGIAFLIGWLPVIGFIAGAVAVVFGIIALVKKQPKGLAITGLGLGAGAVIASVAMTAGVALLADDIDATVQQVEEVTPEPTTEPEPTPEPVPEPEPVEPEGPTDDERAATLEQSLKDTFGVDSFTELLAEDPTMWAGYINGVRIDGPRAHITLQVDRNTPDGKDLGERAAQALSTLLTEEDVEGIDWIIVEDGAGTVIDQKQPAPIM